MTLYLFIKSYLTLLFSFIVQYFFPVWVAIVKDAAFRPLLPSRPCIFSKTELNHAMEASGVIQIAAACVWQIIFCDSALWCRCSSALMLFFSPPCVISYLMSRMTCQVQTTLILKFLFNVLVKLHASELFIY